MFLISYAVGPVGGGAGGQTTDLADADTLLEAMVPAFIVARFGARLSVVSSRTIAPRDDALWPRFEDAGG